MNSFFIGFPAITLEELRREDNPMRLNDEQASWFGNWLCACKLSWEYE